ncbi:hypothetical protein [uncultured Polaribacter sp.]|uniref:hypothetical protein n=1 Tax=uncultured Polaribacter sp. TaxID=174711 RepID=UPI0026263326|nr:hypothetical protein [uncultured Polaribacter sp.]
MKPTSMSSTDNFFTNAFNTIQLDENRKELLKKIAQTIILEFKKEGNANLNFICTHNSRRSQLAQVWGFFAADYFKLPIKSFSGGTEITAFYKNTIKTLENTGFNFDLENFCHQNPVYKISFNGCKKTILGYSKKIDDIDNTKPFIAITTCNNADTNCPFIPDAIERFHLPFVDPKFSDGTVKEEETYLKINREIAAEIYFIFSEVKQQIT